MDDITSFGERLRRRRNALDLTQAELADRAGGVAGTIKSIETAARVKLFTPEALLVRLERRRAMRRVWGCFRQEVTPPASLSVSSTSGM
jgi:transcriptional regulator with XRE-family HTH domain